MGQAFTESEAELISVRNIDSCRRLNRRAGLLYLTQGVSAEDVAIAAVYSAHDLAMRAGKSPIEAIEWMRTALDLQERQLLDQARGVSR